MKDGIRFFPSTVIHARRSSGVTFCGKTMHEDASYVEIAADCKTCIKAMEALHREIMAEHDAELAEIARDANY